MARVLCEGVVRWQAGGALVTGKLVGSLSFEQLDIVAMVLQLHRVDSAGALRGAHGVRDGKCARASEWRGCKSSVLRSRLRQSLQE